jgi:hypothetical protein
MSANLALLESLMTPLTFIVPAMTATQGNTGKWVVWYIMILLCHDIIMYDTCDLVGCFMF